MPLAVAAIAGVMPMAAAQVAVPSSDPLRDAAVWLVEEVAGGVFLVERKVVARLGASNRQQQSGRNVEKRQALLLLLTLMPL